MPVIALVGYTNAGKSTLFNRLTGARRSACNLLFDTLDPKMRAIALPDGTKAILSDTVGFISDLPPDLIAAFRATLEEVAAAHLIIHVRDFSSPDSLAQKHDVEQILKSLSITQPMIEVLNKIDRSPIASYGAQIAISAKTGAGLDHLLTHIQSQLDRQHAKRHIAVSLTPAQSKAQAFLYEKGRVISTTRNGGRAELEVILPAASLGMFQKNSPISP